MALWCYCWNNADGDSEVMKMGNTWKVLAIVFMALFVFLFVLVGYTIHLGAESIENEQYCVYKCVEEHEADSYYVDEVANICLCYKNREIIKQIDL